MINVRRVGTGIGVAAVVIGILYVDLLTETSWATCVLISVLLTQALREAYALQQGNGIAAHARMGVATAFGLLLLRTAADPLGLTPDEARTILFAGVGCAMVAPLALAIAAGPGDDPPGAGDIAKAGATAFPLAWIVLLGSFLLELRLIDGTAAQDIPLGLGLCLAVAASVKLGDSAAYFVGKTIGRHPMCWVSPKKTWEGALASVVGAIAVAVLIGGVLEIDPRLMAGLGLVSNLAGQGGDLVESYFKRAMGAKDSATTFGEMGGILDMLDALFLAAPAAYVWCQLLIVRDMPL